MAQRNTPREQLLFTIEPGSPAEELIHKGAANTEQHFAEMSAHQVAGSIARITRRLGNLYIYARNTTNTNTISVNAANQHIGRDWRLNTVSGGEHFTDYDEYLRVYLEKNLGTDNIEHIVCRGVVYVLKHMEKPHLTLSELLISCKGTFTALATQYAQKEKDAMRVGPGTAVMAGREKSRKPTKAINNRMSWSHGSDGAEGDIMQGVGGFKDYTAYEAACDWRLRVD